jgi:prepilin-type N-terminal cleavage/methylation domain-containing protein
MKRVHTSDYKNGYTLVELLVAIALFAVVGTFLINTLSSTLTISQQITTMNTIQQSGSQTINILGQMLRNAKSFTYASTSSSGPQTTACANPATGLNYVTGLHYIDFTDINNNDVQIECPDTNSPNNITTISSPLGGVGGLPQTLLDTNKVVINSCSITCAQAQNKFIFTLNLNLESNLAGGIPQTYEYYDQGDFETSVQMFNNAN